VVLDLLLAAAKQNKRFNVYVTESRPSLSGYVPYCLSCPLRRCCPLRPFSIAIYHLLRPLVSVVVVVVGVSRLTLCGPCCVLRHDMAAKLTEAGIPVTVIPDTAVGYTIEKVDFAIVGSEAVVESGGIINTIGT